MVFAVSVYMTSCSKSDIGKENSLPYITFGVSGVGVQASTKGLISGEDFTSNANPLVYVYGVRNTTNTIFNATQIFKESDSDNWITAAANQRQWVAGSSYSFYGYTYSPQTPAAHASISLASSGLKITVEQPDVYSEVDMIDYMLSHAFKVADGSNYHIVMLYMQHAMSWIEIVVNKEMSEHNITLTNLTLSNIFRSATMQCESQAIANSGNNNVWTTTLSGSNNLSYSKKSFTPAEKVLGTMRVLAVPQQLTSATTLSVTYTVQEYEGKESTYTQTFNLYNYTPYVWESGHKITYTLTINTGVQLKAQISDWQDVGYIEGVILPTSNTN